MKSQKSGLFHHMLILLALSCLAGVVAAQHEARDKAQADLYVEITTSTNTPIGNQPMYLDVKVTNRGPQTAVDASVHVTWGFTSWFQSATPLADGKCLPLRVGYGNEGICVLDKLEAGQSATFRFNLLLREDFGTRFPPEGRDVQINASAYSRMSDTNTDDNQRLLNLNVKPDPNEPPKVKVTSPVCCKPLANTSSLTIKATAHDPDGVVNKIECYTQKGLIGTTLPEGENQYRVELADVKPGENYVEVCATDNGGRTECDAVSFYVNGPVEVEIISPPKSKVLNAGEKLPVVVQIASHGLAIRKVQIGFNLYYESDDALEATLVSASNAGVMEYRAVLNEVMAYHLGKMDLIARVTDQHGIVSVARLDSFKINHIPSVTLPVAQNPIKTLIAPASLELVALTEDASGEKTVRVDFYANGKLVGSQVKDAIWRGWYGFTWNNVEAGEYTVTAVVTDDNGATATSAPLKIKVRRAPR